MCLQIELTLSELRVLAELAPAGDGNSAPAADGGAAPPTAADASATMAGDARGGSGAALGAEALEQSLRLRGGERSWVGCG